MWSKLSCVVLQFAWVLTSQQLSWIMWSGLALCLSLQKVSGYLRHCSKRSRWFGRVVQYMSGLKLLACSINTNFYYAPELRPFLITRLWQFVRGELDFAINVPVLFPNLVTFFLAEFQYILSQIRSILEPF